jgi:hypothetical protein
VRAGILAAVATLLLVLAVPSVAVADNVQAPRSDDALVSWQYSTILPNRYRSATAWTITNSYETTDLRFVKYADGHRDDLNNYYSVTNSFDDNVLGIWDCVYFTSFTHVKCYHGHAVYNGLKDLGSTYNAALACHETGHSVGLAHSGPQSSGSMVHCMQAQVPPYDPYVGPHNASTINAMY